MLSAEAAGEHPSPEDILEISVGLRHLGHPTPCHLGSSAQGCDLKT